MTTGPLHIPVMVREVVEILQVEEGGWFVDCTLGMGGHSRAILEADPSSFVLGVDRDPEAVDLAAGSLGGYGSRFKAVRANFKDVDAWRIGLPEEAAGILVDLGLSGYQLKAARGFSFRDEKSLDMRMDPEDGTPAWRVVEESGEDKLAELLRTYGEETHARRIARAIATHRRTAPLRDAATLASIVEKAVPRNPRRKIHPATRTFQALRIFVNRELDGLAEFLERAVLLLKPGGRIAVLAYHSLEDRIVKETFRTLSRGCICPPKLPVCGCGRKPSLSLLFRGARKSSPEEVRANPASRSARLRAGERL